VHHGRQEVSPAISLLLPTRGRPRLVRRYLDSLVQQTRDLSRIEVILFADDDDASSHDLRDDRISMTRIVGPRRSMGAMNATCLKQARGKVIIPQNDDFVVRTRDWDEEVLHDHASTPDEIYLAYANDMIAGVHMCHIPIVSRTTCDLLGDPFPPQYPGGFIDYHLFDIFKRLGRLGHHRIRYLEHLVIEHMHFRAGKADYDETYAQRGAMDVGEEVFIGLRRMRQISAERLAAKISGRPLPELPEEDVEIPALPRMPTAFFHYARVFLFDEGLPCRWRFNLFKLFNERYLRNRFGWYPKSWKTDSP